MAIQGLVQLQFSTAHPEVIIKVIDTDGHEKVFRLNYNEDMFVNYLGSPPPNTLEKGIVLSG